MLTEPTIDKLHALHLGAMAAAWTAQRENPKMNEVDFDGRFGMLVDAEHLARDNKRLARALREAKLRLPNACIEDIDYAAKRELDRSLIRQLGTCAWVGSHANVIVTGATGTGKSYVACALAQQACRTGHRASYRRMPRLLEELALAHADGTYTRLLGRSTSWCSTTGVSPRSASRSDATCWRSSRTDTAPARQSSPVSCPSRPGTTTWPIRRSQTPSSTASCTTPTGSS
jgi:IstB-like ATP binding protein